MKVKLLVASLFVLHCVLSLFHLNHTTMWDDEASVVWFAKNYNKYGEIVGYDGTNIFSYRNGQLINDELVYNNPPLDIYFTSYVIKYFGEDDFSIRLAFAICGILGLLLFVYCIWLITGKDDHWFVYSTIILLLSVNYLLIEGNSRYYSLNFFFGSVSLLASLNIAYSKSENLIKKASWLIIQLISIYFLFLSHYLAAICWWLMCFVILIQYKQVKVSIRDKFTLLAVLFNLIVFIIIGKYFLDHQVLNRPDMSNDDIIWVKYFKLMGWLFNDLNRSNIIPLWSVLLFIYLFIFQKKLLSTDFKRLVGFSLVFLGASYFLNPQSTSKSTCFDLRYIYVVIPLLYMWIGYLLKLLHERFKMGKYLSWLLAVLYINTTVLCYIPESTPVRWLLPNFVLETMKPYPTAYSESIAYINKNFKKRTKILTVPGYHNTVFLRYVSDKIEITNTLDGNSPLSKAVVDSLGMGCLYIGNCKPEYIFQFGAADQLDTYPYSGRDYKYIDTIPVYAFGIDITRPELFWHSFGPKKVNDLSSEALYIYHD